MSVRRLWRVIELDLRHNARRPLFWIWALVIALVAWGTLEGAIQIESGDSGVGGAKAHQSSEFGVAFLLSIMVMVEFFFFVAVAAGTTLIRDGELKVGELLHSTPLKPWEYVWGKFLAALLSFGCLLAFFIAVTMFSHYVLSGAEQAETIGPFALSNYLRPALLFGIPPIVFVAGLTFYLGERTRRPILVFFLPVALFLLCDFLLWDYSPADLAPWKNQVLMFLDPVGFRWLNETWLQVDRGAEFYNTQPVALDGLFVANRVLLVLLGVLAVHLSSRHFARTLRGSPLPTKKRWFRRKNAQLEPVEPDPVQAPVTPRVLEPLASLGMRSKPPGFLRGASAVAGAELRELKSQPGLYLFVPLIVVMAVALKVTFRGAFDTPVLATPGLYTLRMTGVLTTLISLLLMFYMVESLRREAGTGLGAIYYATPTRTAAMLFGKALANSLVGVAILLITFVTAFIVLLFEPVAFDATPFLIVWGLLLPPTFLVWCSFLSATYSLVRNRYTTYAIGLGVLVYTGFKLVEGEVSWVTNWPMWSMLQWTDMGLFELVRRELVLNRLLCLALTVFFIALTVRWFPRRRFDGVRTLMRLQPRALLRTSLVLSPLALPAVLLAIVLDRSVQQGHQGDAAEKVAKDYWRKHLNTWKGAPQPSLEAVDIALDLEPAEGSFEVQGSYRLVNRQEAALTRFALTTGPSWQERSWTLNGEAFEPEGDFLSVFELAEPLAAGEQLELGFRYQGQVPSGATKNGGGAPEFILASGVVLTSFRPTFAPVVGYLEEIGIDEDNRTDSKIFPPDFYEGQTEPLFGSGGRCSVRTRITGPEEYRFNGVGSLVEEEVTDGRRSVVWQTEHPVSFFNVVGGRWEVREGEGTAIYYHPEHTANLDEMIEALDGARRHYSEWFHPFPWETLKLSEFPALASYAQGFPTNITFSESIGFLTKSTPETSAAFLVTAHEAAHQWWGNLLMPGQGPGGNILSEGMSHFSTLLLQEQLRGLRGRIGFCTEIEDRYGENRQVDSERPLTEVDGSRAGDQTVIYDKGGWVPWMLLQLMGREACLEGTRSFIGHYASDPDHPVLQDFVAHLEPFAPDPVAYRAFCDQWYFDVVMPEYELGDLERREAGGGWEVELTVTNIGTGRMPIEVAATRGERFPDQVGDEAEFEQETLTDGGYREVRETIVLGAGEEGRITLRADFEPQRVWVDPDALVLMLKRRDARYEF